MGFLVTQQVRSAKDVKTLGHQRDPQGRTEPQRLCRCGPQAPGEPPRLSLPTKARSSPRRGSLSPPYSKHASLSLSCQLLLIHQGPPPGSLPCAPWQSTPSTLPVPAPQAHIPRRSVRGGAGAPRPECNQGWALTAEGVCVRGRLLPRLLPCSRRVGGRGWGSLPVPAARAISPCCARSRGRGPRIGPRRGCAEPSRSSARPSAAAPAHLWGEAPGSEACGPR